MLPIPIPPQLYGHAVLYPYYLTKPTARRVLSGCYIFSTPLFPIPIPYIILMYLFFLDEEEDKAFFVKPKRFVDVDETFRTYSSQQIN